MHIDKYTKVPIDDSGENFLYIKNHCLGVIKSSDGSDVVYNKKTGEAFSTMALYEQIVDEEGKPLSSPIVGDNDDFYLLSGGGKESLVSYFRAFNDSSATLEELEGKKEKEE